VAQGGLQDPPPCPYTDLSSHHTTDANLLTRFRPSNPPDRVGTAEERFSSLRQGRTWHPNSSGDRWVLLQEVWQGSQTAGDLIQYRGESNPPITTITPHHHEHLSHR